MKKKLSELGYSVYSICYDTYYYRNGVKIIIVQDGKIIDNGIECPSFVSTQREINEIQIEFNNLQRDVKELKQ